MMNRTCPFCGNPLSPEDAFCNICGNKIPQPEMIKDESVQKKNCSKCGCALSETDMFCPMCGSPQEIAKDPDFEDLTKEQSINSDMNNNAEINPVTEKNTCPVCGSIAIPGERFCIQCGALIEKECQSTEVNQKSNTILQDAIYKFSHKNSFVSLFVRFAWIFALYFPIYAMTSHIDSLSGLFNILENFSVIMQYLYFIALIILYGNRKYVLLITALVLRAINSIWTICVTSEPISSVERLLVLLPLIVYLSIRFSQTPEFYQLKSKINAFRSN